LLVFAAIAATALALLLGPAALAVVRGRLNLGILFITSHIFFVDSADFIMRLYHRHLHASAEPDETAAALSIPLRSGELSGSQKRFHVRPYALLASVANLGSGVESFIRAMQPYKHRLWVIDDASTDETRLILRKAGIRCLAGFPNRKKPGALRELVRQLPPEIVTVLVLDPDCRILDVSEGSLVDLESSLFDFQRSGMAAVCPRLTLKGEGWLTKLQRLEYCFTFSLVRKSLADLAVTSGVALYRRDALESALERHSLSVYAEDLRNALLLLARGERIYYDGRLVVETEPKRTWREWFSQRVGWFYGLLKVYLEQVRDVGRIIRQGSLPFYNYAVYLGVFTILLHPVKVVSLLLLTLSLANGADYVLGLGVVPDHRWSEPSYFLVTWLMYTGLTVVMFYLCVDRRERAELAPVVPVYAFYALAQIVPATLGYLNWFTVRVTGRRLYRDHFEGGGRLDRDLTSGPGRVPA
jgi:cellulose synthase/poly-beta-1,6-N-acetylglucosamine synthase-like glycosyltransferase